MKLSEIQGEQAISALADLIDPMVRIFKDKEILKDAQEERYLDMVKKIFKRKPKDVIEVLAVLDLQDPETYKVTFLTLPSKILEMVNDKELMSLFSSAAQMVEKTASGSAPENTAE